jgi:hypothetical protein
MLTMGKQPSFRQLRVFGHPDIAKNYGAASQSNWATQMHQSTNAQNAIYPNAIQLNQNAQNVELNVNSCAQ